LRAICGVIFLHQPLIKIAHPQPRKLCAVNDCHRGFVWFDLALNLLAMVFSVGIGAVFGCANFKNLVVGYMCVTEPTHRHSSLHTPFAAVPENSGSKSLTYQGDPNEPNS
jgi:hypothetical protein